MTAWKAGAITIATTTGPDAVPGWLKHPFGMDIAYIHNEIVWVIHHLPTGRSICAVDGNAEMAVKAVDTLLGMGDWEFSDHAGVSEYKDALIRLADADVAAVSPMGAKRIVGPNPEKEVGE